ncbi:MAG: Histidine-tRNA ligase [candidate division WS6 bacterium GW2011_GWF1_35_23]|uniref:Histidine--tRNA ligase n=1 Tax=candidate division WS6 bacterium GW2011_GWF1_35_23 TaxID=1619097 RepID=A0A0G0C114_9BACT|nr:MAG: Histidine-tRNA ligase [candidate division WS6 bacterium GW2011_GWF1_35_23]
MNINVLPGFQETPVLERAEVLLTKGGGETDKQIYQFEKGDTKLAMRFDLTVPLARYVAKNQNELVFPFKRYAIDRVYRGEKPQAGRFREFYQCDIDVIGRDTLDLSYDAEIPSIIASIFSSLELDFTIKINNRKILNGLFESLDIKDSVSVLRTLDSIEKVGEKKTKEELKDIGLDEKQIEEIFNFYKLNTKTNEGILTSLKALEISSDIFKKGVEELEFVLQEVETLGIGESVKIDLTVARGLDYYTGTVYETILNKYPEIGSVCGGGRYDDLAGYYTNQKFPGVGISIGLTRLFDQLKNKGEINLEDDTPTVMLVLPLTEDRKLCLELADTLRENFIPTEVAPVGNMKKALNYANKLNIPYVIFIGEDEIKENKYTIKNMITGEQKSVAQEDILEAF